MRRLIHMPGLSAMIELAVLLVVGLAVIVAAAHAQDSAPAPPPPPQIVPPDEKPAPPSAKPRSENARQFLRAMGVDDSFFEKLFDGRSLHNDEVETLLMVLSRMRDDFRPRDIHRWRRAGVRWSTLQGPSTEYQGQIYSMTGRVRRIEKLRPLPNQAIRFDVEEYYRLELTQPRGEPPLIVYSRDVPREWIGAEDLQSGETRPLDQPAGFDGVFLKRGEEGPRQPLLLATLRMAWYPDRVDASAGITEDHVLLARLGMDVGLLAAIRNGTEIRAAERDCFYGMLRAVGGASLEELEQQAAAGLARRTEQLPEVERQLDKQLAGFEGSEKEQKRLVELRTALRQESRSAAKGAFSVWPLYKTPQEQHGRLITLEGTANRVQRIPVDNPRRLSGEVAEVTTRFGIDQHWEIYLFTDDSQSNPVVFCVRELPEGMPTGDGINVHLRITGFYFKYWGYTSHETDEQGQSMQQYAPVLIGLRPRWYPPEDTASAGSRSAIIAGAAFILVLVGLWTAVWLYSRGDRKFEKGALARNFALEEGTSLDDLGIESQDKPDFSKLD